jgi:hypothetical protein
MNRILTPIILVVLAVGLFMVYTNDEYANIPKLQESLSSYQEALAQSQEVLELRNKLLQERNNLPADGLQRLEQLLPDSIDSIKLILNVNDVAVRHHMQVTHIMLEGDNTKPAPSAATPDGSVGTALGGDATPLGSVSLSFSVKSDYNDFRLFLEDLEQSLRLMDVQVISFTTSNERTDQYSFTIKTYWLK